MHWVASAIIYEFYWWCCVRHTGSFSFSGRHCRKCHRAGKPRIETMCSEPYLCERTKTRGPLGCRCFYAKKLKISPYEHDWLKQSVGTTKPAIRYYICETTETTTAPGQQMVRGMILTIICYQFPVFLSSITWRYLASNLEQSIDDVR